jgi:hypothetical protein
MRAPTGVLTRPIHELSVDGGLSRNAGPRGAGRTLIVITLAKQLL